jgi:hypothetical protein
MRKIDRQKPSNKEARGTKEGVAKLQFNRCFKKEINLS